MSLLRGLLACAWIVSAAERPPQVAGRFYPGDPTVLSAAVENLLKKAPAAQLGGDLVALVVPHAGLEFSGATAARAHKLVYKGQWDSIILIGSGHRVGIAEAAVFPGDYETPVGKAEYDSELAKAIIEADSRIVESEEAHRGEHSLEVHVPFLLKRLGRFKMAGLVMNTEELEPAIRVGEAIAEAIQGKRALVIASSDLSHYTSGEAARKVDASTVLALQSLDPAFFWTANRLLMARGLPDLKCTWCGEGAVTAALTAAKRLGADKAQVLALVNSGDVVPERDASRVVGYAAVAFVKTGEPTARRSPYVLREQDKKFLLREARGAIQAALEGMKPQSPPLSAVAGFNLPAPVFVTLDIYEGGRKQLRGCIGTTLPQEPLWEAVRRYALAAAFEDPRFAALTKPELGQVRIEISILSPQRPVRDAGEVKSGMGVVVQQNGHGGLFLPQVWEQIPGKAEFLGELCSQKAGLARDCWKDPDAHLSVFDVESFEEPRL